MDVLVTRTALDAAVLASSFRVRHGALVERLAWEVLHNDRASWRYSCTVYNDTTRIYTVTFIPVTVIPAGHVGVQNSYAVNGTIAREGTVGAAQQNLQTVVEWQAAADLCEAEDIPFVDAVRRLATAHLFERAAISNRDADDWQMEAFRPADTAAPHGQLTVTFSRINPGVIINVIAAEAYERRNNLDGELVATWFNTFLADEFIERELGRLREVAARVWRGSGSRPRGMRDPNHTPPVPAAAIRSILEYVAGGSVIVVRAVHLDEGLKWSVEWRPDYDVTPKSTAETRKKAAEKRKTAKKLPEQITARQRDIRLDILSDDIND